MRHTGELVTQWPSVPAEAVAWMLPELDSFAAEMTAAIMREVPEYGRADDESCTRIVHQVATDAVRQFAARITDPAAPREPATRIFHDIGRLEAVQGRSLDTLHAALRAGVRVTWQRLRELARHGGGDAELFVRIGEAISCYLDELTAACSAGYAEAEHEFAGGTEGQRRRLLDLLVAEQPAPAETISGLARALGWRLPRRVAVVALAERVRSAPGPPPLPRDVLVSLTRREPCILVPDPDGPGRRGLLEAALRNWPTAGWPRDRASSQYLAALGPAVPLARASGSLRWARRGLALGQRGLARGADGIVRCDEHLATLVLLADAELADTLSSQALAPLRRLRPDHADRLALTLLAWLESADNAGAAARRLHVHPQTVRYRLRQLTELFGDGLSDPDTRFTLQVALRARRLRAAASSASAQTTVRSE